MATFELSFDLGNFDIVVSFRHVGGWPSVEVSQDINGGEYQILLATLSKFPYYGADRAAVHFVPGVDGFHEFMHWAGALCHAGNADINQTIGFFNRLNLLLKMDVGNWERVL